MGQIHRTAHADELGQAGLQPLRCDVRIGLRRQFGLQRFHRRPGDRLPTAPFAQEPVGRRVGDFGFGPRTDDTLHQHPFGLAPSGGCALDMTETLDQQRLEAAQHRGARIIAKRQFHRQRRKVMAIPATISAPDTTSSRVTASSSSATPPSAATSGVASCTVASVASPRAGDTRFHTT